MITEEQLIEIGTITKVHGLKGEVQVALTDTVFDDVEQCEYLVVPMDGIFVPFFIESYRMRGETGALMLFEGIDSADKASAMCGLPVYFDRRCFTAEEADEYDEAAEEEQGLIGYKIIDINLGEIGEITDINDQTANVLFIVNDEIMIPAADELIVDIDDEKQVVIMQLPQGLLDLENVEEV